MTLNECSCENPEIEDQSILSPKIEKVIACGKCGAIKIVWKKQT